MNYVAFQYSEALFSLALEEKAVDSVLADLESFYSSIDDEIYKFLSHPKITKIQKKEIVGNVISNKLVKNFMFVLIDNSRIELLEDALIEYKKLNDSQNKVMQVKVFSKKVLNKEQHENLRSSLETNNNRKVELISIVDNPIVGGARIEYEGMVIRIIL